MEWNWRGAQLWYTAALVKLSMSSALCGDTVFAYPFLLLVLICAFYSSIFYVYIFQHITDVILIIIAAGLR